MRMRSLVLGLLLCCAPSMYGAAILSITPDTVNTTQGSEFAVDVTLSGLPDIIGFQFDVLFPDFLSLVDVTEAGYFALNGVSFSPGTPGTGTVTGIFDVLIGPGPLPDPDALVTIRFYATSQGTGSIGLANVQLLDPSFADAEIGALGSATVTVTAAPSGEQVPEPSSVLLVLTGAAAVLAKKRLQASS